MERKWLRHRCPKLLGIGVPKYGNLCQIEIKESNSSLAGLKVKIKNGKEMVTHVDRRGCVREKWRVLRVNIALYILVVYFRL